MATEELTKLKRGDRVRYGETIYFFRPNGGYCYLFLYEKDMDDVTKAIYHVPRSKVKLYVSQPPLYPLTGRVPSFRHPLSIPDEETEFAMGLIRQLSSPPVYRIVETKIHDKVYKTREEAEAALPANTETSTYRIIENHK